MSSLGEAELAELPVSAPQNMDSNQNEEEKVGS